MIHRFAAFALIAAAASAQTTSQVQCVANTGVPPPIRAEGRTELVGDIYIECTGGPAGARFSGTLTVRTTAPITGKRFGDKTEALLLIDEPRLPPNEGVAAVPGINVFQAVATSANTISFPNLVLTAPGPNRIRQLRITNIRVDASAVAVNALVTFSPWNSMAIAPLEGTVAFVHQGLRAFLAGAGPDGSGRIAVQGCQPNHVTLLANPAGQGASIDFVLGFGEVSKHAWRSHLIDRDRTLPGYRFSDESGFFDSSFPATDGLNEVGRPTTGTRLLATITDIPAGVAVFATLHPVTATTNSNPNPVVRARLIRTAPGGHNPATTVAATTTALFNGTAAPIAPVPIVNGSATLAWEIDASTDLLDSMGFGIVVAHAGNLPRGSLRVTSQLGPLDSLAPTVNITPLFDATAVNLDRVPLVPCGAVGPDLTVGALHGLPRPLRASPAAPLIAFFSIRNYGSARADTFRYSLEAVPSQGPITAFHWLTAVDVDPGKDTTASLRLSIGSTTPPGIYKLRLRADSENQVTEPDENDNSMELPLEIGCGVEVELRVLQFGAAGGTAPNFITTNCPLEIISKPDWVTIAGSSLSASPNTTGQSRQGVVRLKGGVVNVWQNSAPQPSCAPTLIPPTFWPPTQGSPGGWTSTWMLNATPDCSWRITSSEWAQAFPVQGTGSAQIRINVFPNFSESPRPIDIYLNGRQAAAGWQQASYNSSNDRATRQIYFNFFGRLPSDMEAAFQQLQLEAGVSRAELIDRFMNSMEFGNGGRFVAGLYVGILNRDAEYGGWLFQRNALATGVVSDTQLADNFVNSDEFRLINGNLSDLDLIKLLYRQILFREGSATEWEFHLNTLRTRSVTRSQMVSNFLNSAEFRSTTGPRLTAFLLYAAILNREPTPTEFAQMKARVAAGTPLRALIESIMTEFDAILE